MFENNPVSPKKQPLSLQPRARACPDASYFAGVGVYDLDFILTEISGIINLSMLDEVIIRKVKKEDLKAIPGAYIKAFRPIFESQNLSKETIKECELTNNEKHFAERVKGNYFFVAEINNKIVGMIGLRKDDGSDIQNRVSTFFVLPKYRGQGIGTLLFNKVLNLAKKLNIDKMVVSSSLFAEDIYKHWGFVRKKIIRKHYPNGDGYKMYWMEKKLK